MLRTGIIFAVTVVTCASAVFLSGCGSTIVQPPIIIPQSDLQPVPTVQADVDIQILTQDLQPFGHWVDSAEYHMCWAPNPAGVRTDWRPYTVGRWAYTEFGWTWISDEPWGHITYHYGSWVDDPIHGWIWVPGQFGHRHGWLGGATMTTSAGRLYRRTCACVPKGSDTWRRRRSDGGRLNSVSLMHAT